MRKLRPREDRGFPKVLLQVRSRVLASTAQNLARSGSQRIPTTFPSISDFLELEPFVSVSHLSAQYYEVVLASWSGSETSGGRPLFPGSPGLGPGPQRRVGFCGWSKVGLAQPVSLQPTDCSQTQSLLSDAEIQESSKLECQLATSFGLFWASRGDEFNLS